MIIFCVGWCRWYIGFPAAAAVAVSVVFCLKEYRYCQEDGADTILKRENWIRAAAAVLIVLLWVGLSGVGGYVWQNTDHAYRNEMFLLLTEQKWPLVKEVMTESGPQGRGVVYYIGSWLPAAAAGKLFGTGVGWAMQYLWTAAGVLLTYAHICVYRKKSSVWPRVQMIYFSAPDAIGVLLVTADPLKIFGEAHI